MENWAGRLTKEQLKLADKNGWTAAHELAWGGILSENMLSPDISSIADQYSVTLLPMRNGYETASLLPKLKSESGGRKPIGTNMTGKSKESLLKCPLSGRNS